MAKRCIYCGRYFIPDRRMGERQKACRRDACKRKRKGQAQRSWSEKNAGYFKGRYLYVKEWRQRKKQSIAHLQLKQDKIQDGNYRMIQDEIPCSKLYLKLILPIPANLKGVIQDEIRFRRVDGYTFEAYG